MVTATTGSLFVQLLGQANADLAERLRRGVVAVRGPAGGGSGTIWSADGTIVTNSHVVQSDRAEVVTWDGRVFQAEVTARDVERDLALLRVRAEGLSALDAADSSAVRAGQLALAAGNPWGQRGVITAGIILSMGGATAENGVPLPEVIRADLRLAPGNSGGPLADASGRVIGINAMIAGGMAVAVPSNTVARLLKDGTPGQAFIGVIGRPAPLPPAIAASYSSPDGAGLILTDIADHSPAARAGLLPGDVVVRVGETRGGLDVIARGFRGMRAGAPLRMSVLRGGVPYDVEVIPDRRVN